MKEDYLWDKSGEPDIEVQQLESILGSLSYQPRDFQPKVEKPATHSRNWTPILAIAATLILTLLATGLWVLSRNVEKLPPSDQVATGDVQTPPQSQIGWTQWRPENSENVQGRKVRSVTHSNRANSNRALQVAEMNEARKAKVQLMLALRVASEKLSMAQKKVLNPTTPIQIRNQHKIS